MRGAILLRNLRLFEPRHFLSLLPISKPNPCCNPSLLRTTTSSKLWRHFSSDGDENSNSSSPPKETTLAPQAHEKKDNPYGLADVSNKELKARLKKYLQGDADALPSVMEAFLARKLTGKHEETDDELMDELRERPLADVNDEDFESDFEEMHSTDEEIDDLYDARDIVMRRMAKDEFFNMDDKKWDDMVKEGIEHGFLKNTRECEEILEDMLSWEKLLPDEIKQKVEKKFNEIGDMIERGDIDVAGGHKLFKEFEDQMVLESAKIMEAEGPPNFDDAFVPDKKKDLDDPPGEGPILRWQTRVVFAPGGDAWHPTNRKVKLSVTVKELGLSKHQFRRLRELVGKRYNPGKDELTITSERFEHREENRKDCLRTLFALIEEAGKANKIVEDVRTGYVKDRLMANPEFMKRLRAKTMKKIGSKSLPA